jgi:hypothetical protein
MEAATPLELISFTTTNKLMDFRQNKQTIATESNAH